MGLGPFEIFVKRGKHNGEGLRVITLFFCLLILRIYTDFDNIFAPRKIATVGRNIGSVRLRPFKFQWQ